MAINVDEFECGYSDETEPGYHIIEFNGEDVLLIPRLELNQQRLECDFNILKYEYSRSDIESLIKITLLERFELNYFEGKATTLKLLNLGTQEL